MEVEGGDEPAVTAMLPKEGDAGTEMAVQPPQDARMWAVRSHVEAVDWHTMEDAAEDAGAAEG